MKYIVSGLSPGKGGVPKLLEYLQFNSSENFKLITPPNLIIKNKYLNYAIQLIILKIFRIRLLFLFNKTVVLIHFQSIGLKTSKYLIKNNKTYLYLIDNTFFCLKSYNNRDENECLDCIKDYSSSVKNNCSSFHFKYSRSEYINFYEFLNTHTHKINFLTLSDTQSKLLKQNLSQNISVQSLYFLTDDLVNRQTSKIKSEKCDYDIVFHGSSHQSKGSNYILKLANSLPEFNFLFPFDRNEIKFNFKKTNNIFFKKFSWETGLQKSVINAKLVLTPSNWSNTPEASTLKSILENGSVAMLKTKYGYVNELEKFVLCLSGNIESDKVLILDYMKNNSKLNSSENSSLFFKEYNSKAKNFINFFEINQK